MPWVTKQPLQSHAHRVLQRDKRNQSLQRNAIRAIDLEKVAIADPLTILKIFKYRH